jgi:hypothetical protein
VAQEARLRFILLVLGLPTHPIEVQAVLVGKLPRLLVVLEQAEFVLSGPDVLVHSPLQEQQMSNKYESLH